MHWILILMLAIGCKAHRSAKGGALESVTLANEAYLFLITTPESELGEPVVQKSSPRSTGKSRGWPNDIKIVPVGESRVNKASGVDFIVTVCPLQARSPKECRAKKLTSRFISSDTFEKNFEFAADALHVKYSAEEFDAIKSQLTKLARGPGNVGLQSREQLESKLGALAEATLVALGIRSAYRKTDVDLVSGATCTQTVAMSAGRGKADPYPYVEVSCRLTLDSGWSRACIATSSGIYGQRSGDFMIIDSTSDLHVESLNFTGKASRSLQSEHTDFRLRNFDDLAGTTDLMKDVVKSECSGEHPFPRTEVTGSHDGCLVRLSMDEGSKLVAAEASCRSALCELMWRKGESAIRFRGDGVFDISIDPSSPVLRELYRVIEKRPEECRGGGG